MMLFRDVRRFINPEHQGDIFARGRSGNDDFLRPAAVDMGASFGRIGEEAGRLNHDLDAERLPRQFARIALGENFYRTSVDGDRIIRSGDLARIGTVVRVVLKQMRAFRRLDEIVYGCDFDFRAALQERLEEIPSDAAEAVDSDAHSEEGVTVCLSQTPLFCWEIEGLRLAYSVRQSGH